MNRSNSIAAGPDAQLMTIVVNRRNGKIEAGVTFNARVEPGDRFYLAKAADWVMRQRIPEYKDAQAIVNDAAMAGFGLPKTLRKWLADRENKRDQSA